MKFQIGDRVKMIVPFYSQFYLQCGTITKIIDADYEVKFDKFPKIGYYWLEDELSKISKLEEAMK